MRTPRDDVKLGVLALLLLLYVAACAVERGKVHVVDGKSYCVASGIWRNKWWQHYERGLSCATGGFWDEAIGSFKVALAATRGQKDRWYVNTYGVNFIDDYFPHRELGIVYYRVGRDDEAQRELERSLRMTPSAKAKFYLNEVRRRLIRQAQRDQAAPRIVIGSPLDGLLTNDLTVDVTGYAEDDTFVESLVINGQARFIELAEPHLTFTREVRLQDGSNRIAIVATDLAGWQTQQHITVDLDRHGPSLSVESVAPLGASSQRVRVRGHLSDRSTIQRFELAGRRIPLAPGAARTFDAEIDIQHGMTALAFEAQDAAGNVTRGQVALPSPGGQPPDIREGKRPLSEQVQRASLRAAPGVANRATAPLLAGRTRGARHRREKAQPVIALTTHRDGVARGQGPCLTQDEIVVYEDRAVLEIQVTDESEIIAFAINGQPRLRHRGIQLFFTEIVPLPFATTNRFHLEAVDTWGNTTACEITVTHEIQTSRQIDYRLLVVQAPFNTEEAGCTPTWRSATADDVLFMALDTRQRFNLIAPASDNVKETDVDGRIQGKVCEGKTREGIDTLQVFADFVEPSLDASQAPHESRIREDVYDENLDRPRLHNLMTALALKLLRHFPLKEGYIKARKGKKVVTNLDKSQRVRPRMKLVVYREKSARDDRGSMTPKQDILGEAQIISVSNQSSEARLLNVNTSGDVQPNDKVITK